MQPTNRHPSYSLISYFRKICNIENMLRWFHISIDWIAMPTQLYHDKIKIPLPSTQNDVLFQEEPNMFLTQMYLTEMFRLQFETQKELLPH